MFYTIVLLLGIALLLLGVKNLLAPFLTSAHGVNGVVAGVLLVIGGNSQNPWALATLSAAAFAFVYVLNRPPSLVPAMARRFVREVVFDSQDPLCKFTVQVSLSREKLFIEEKIARMAIALDEMSRLSNTSIEDVASVYCEAMHSQFLEEVLKRNLLASEGAASQIEMRLQIYNRSLENLPSSPRNIGRPLLALLALPEGDIDQLKTVDFSGELAELERTAVGIDWAHIVKRGIQAGLVFLPWQEKAKSILELDSEFICRVVTKEESH